MKTMRKAIWAAALAAVGTAGGVLGTAFQDTDGLTGRELAAAITAGLVAAVIAGGRVYNVTNEPS